MKAEIHFERAAAADGCEAYYIRVILLGHGSAAAPDALWLYYSFNHEGRTWNLITDTYGLFDELWQKAFAQPNSTKLIEPEVRAIVDDFYIELSEVTRACLRDARLGAILSVTLGDDAPLVRVLRRYIKKDEEENDKEAVEQKCSSADSAKLAPPEG